MTISRFWLDRVAGKPLSRAWAKKDRQIARNDPTYAEVLTMRDWLALSEADRQTIEQHMLQAA